MGGAPVEPISRGREMLTFMEPLRFLKDFLNGHIRSSIAPTGGVYNQIIVLSWIEGSSIEWLLLFD